MLNRSSKQYTVDLMTIGLEMQGKLVIQITDDEIEAQGCAVDLGGMAKVGVTHLSIRTVPPP